MQPSQHSPQKLSPTSSGSSGATDIEFRGFGCSSVAKGLKEAGQFVAWLLV
jgi:hypothetical protein